MHNSSSNNHNFASNSSRHPVISRQLQQQQQQSGGGNGFSSIPIGPSAQSREERRAQRQQMRHDLLRQHVERGGAAAAGIGVGVGGIGTKNPNLRDAFFFGTGGNKKSDNNQQQRAATGPLVASADFNRDMLLLDAAGASAVNRGGLSCAMTQSNVQIPLAGHNDGGGRNQPNNYPAFFTGHVPQQQQANQPNNNANNVFGNGARHPSASPSASAAVDPTTNKNSIGNTNANGGNGNNNIAFGNGYVGFGLSLFTTFGDGDDNCVHQPQPDESPVLSINSHRHRQRRNGGGGGMGGAMLSSNNTYTQTNTFTNSFTGTAATITDDNNSAGGSPRHHNYSGSGGGGGAGGINHRTLLHSSRSLGGVVGVVSSSSAGLNTHSGGTHSGGGRTIHVSGARFGHHKPNDNANGGGGGNNGPLHLDTAALRFDMSMSPVSTGNIILAAAAASGGGTDSTPTAFDLQEATPHSPQSPPVSPSAQHPSRFGLNGNAGGAIGAITMPPLIGNGNKHHSKKPNNRGLFSSSSRKGGANDNDEEDTFTDISHMNPSEVAFNLERAALRAQTAAVAVGVYGAGAINGSGSGDSVLNNAVGANPQLAIALGHQQQLAPASGGGRKPNLSLNTAATFTVSHANSNNGPIATTSSLPPTAHNRSRGNISKIKNTKNNNNFTGEDALLSPTGLSNLLTSPPVFFSDSTLIDRDVSVACVNIVAFHSYALVTHGAELAKQHEVIVQIIHETARRCGGVLDTFSGDKFWVSFNATSRCVKSAVAAASFAVEVSGIINKEAAEARAALLKEHAEFVAREEQQRRERLGLPPAAPATNAATAVGAPSSAEQQRQNSSSSGGSGVANVGVSGTAAATAAATAASSSAAVIRRYRPRFRAALNGVTVGVATGRAYVGPMGTRHMKRHTIVSNAVTEAAALERQCGRYPDCGVMVGGDMIPAIEGFCQYLVIDACALPGSGGKRRRIATVKGLMCAEGCDVRLLRGAAAMAYQQQLVAFEREQQQRAAAAALLLQNHHGHPLSPPPAHHPSASSGSGSDASLSGGGSHSKDTAIITITPPVPLPSVEVGGSGVGPQQQQQQPPVCPFPATNPYAITNDFFGAFLEGRIEECVRLMRLLDAEAGASQQYWAAQTTLKEASSALAKLQRQRGRLAAAATATAAAAIAASTGAAEANGGTRKAEPETAALLVAQLEKQRKQLSDLDAQIDAAQARVDGLPNPTEIMRGLRKTQREQQQQQQQQQNPNNTAAATTTAYEDGEEISAQMLVPPYTADQCEHIAVMLQFVWSLLSQNPPCDGRSYRSPLGEAYARRRAD